MNKSFMHGKSAKHIQPLQRNVQNQIFNTMSAISLIALKIQKADQSAEYQDTRLKDHIRLMEMELVPYSLNLGALIVTIDFINSPLDA